MTPDVASAHGWWILLQFSAGGCRPAHAVERGMACSRARLPVQDMAEGQTSAGVGVHAGFETVGRITGRPGRLTTTPIASTTSNVTVSGLAPVRSICAASRQSERTRRKDATDNGRSRTIQNGINTQLPQLAGARAAFVIKTSRTRPVVDQYARKAEGDANFFEVELDNEPALSQFGG